MPSSLSHLSHFSTSENVLLSGSHMKSVTFILTAGLQSKIEICCVRAMARNWQGGCLLLPIPLPCPWQAKKCVRDVGWQLLGFASSYEAFRPEHCVCMWESEGKRSPWDNTPKRLYLEWKGRRECGWAGGQTAGTGGQAGHAEVAQRWGPSSWEPSQGIAGTCMHKGCLGSPAHVCVTAGGWVDLYLDSKCCGCEWNGSAYSDANRKPCLRSCLQPRLLLFDWQYKIFWRLRLLKYTCISKERKKQQSL